MPLGDFEELLAVLQLNQVDDDTFVGRHPSKNPPRTFGGMGMTLVAYPLACGDRTVSPTGIEIVPTQGPPVRARTAGTRT